VNWGLTVSYQYSTVDDACGVDTSFQLYINVPYPLGLVEPLPSRITKLPTFAVRLGPALATGARNVHWRSAKSNATVRSTRIVNVSRLVTVLFAGTGAKCRAPCPGTT